MGRGRLHFSSLQWTRLLAFAVLLATFASVAISHTGLVEDRGVYDDICYLRQAHLFRTLGIARGLDTDYAAARYVRAKAMEAGLPAAMGDVPCHNYRGETDKTVIQYPPGTGYLLSAFPPGIQATGLYVFSSATITLIVLLLVATRRTRLAVAVIAGLGCLTLYLMVNPAKASYSIAPTMALCVVIALVIVKAARDASAAASIFYAAMAGLLIGAATDIRVVSALLAVGIGLWLALSVARRRPYAVPCLIALCVGFAIGASPTLIANAINTGSPFIPTYAASDVVIPALNARDLLDMAIWYGGHTHGVLLWICVATAIASAAAFRSDGRAWLISALAIAAITLTANVFYLIIYPVKSQYYTVPPIMLTLWIIGLTWAEMEQKDRKNQSSRSLYAASGAFAVAILLPAFMASLAATNSPTANRQAILWIGGSSWSDSRAIEIEYRMKRHAASGLTVLLPSQQDRIIDAIAADCLPQHFVATDDRMLALANRRNMQRADIDLLDRAVFIEPAKCDATSAAKN